jgi:exoribonuclease R
LLLKIKPEIIILEMLENITSCNHQLDIEKNEEIETIEENEVIETIEIEENEEIEIENENEDLKTEKKQKKRKENNQKEKKNKKRKKQSRYEEYYCDIMIEKGILNGEIHINKLEKEKEFFIKTKDGKNINIKTDLLKNRSIEGDFVAVEIVDFEKNEGRVVKILNSKMYQLDIIGKIIFDNFEGNYLIFQPLDYKFPKMIFNKNEMKNDMNDSLKLEDKDCYFVGNYLKWGIDSKLPIGKIIRKIGKSNELNTEIEKIFIMNNIRIKYGFNTKIMNEAKYLLMCHEEEIQKEINNGRVDLREELVFTIDPEESLDLDDALSIKKLDNGNYQVGIHIADVSHYIKEGSYLDSTGKDRISTIYLPHCTIPIFPKILSEDLLSLLPGKERFCFSLFININNGEICEEEIHFKKTIINSKFKFSYKEVEEILEKDNLEGNEVYENLNILHEISKNLKHKRENTENNFNINNDDKLNFKFDKERNIVDGFKIDKNKKSKSLVEELMILANISAAKRMYSYKDINSCLFRNNKKPDLEVFNNYENSMDKEKYDEEVIQFLLEKKYKKSLQHANYINTDNLEVMYHFGLNMNFYSHFTSPIRRYQDILVHRIIYNNENKMNSKKFFDEELLEKMNQNTLSMKRAKNEMDLLLFDNYLKNIDKSLFLGKGFIIESSEKKIKVYFQTFKLEKRFSKKEIQINEINQYFSLNVYYDVDLKKFIFK